MCGKAGQDLELLQQAIAGDNKAYWLLIERHKRLVYWACNKHLLKKDDKDADLKAHQIGVLLEKPLFFKKQIDEIAHDVFVHAYNILETFRGDSKFSTWLCGVAINHCRKARARALRDRNKTVALDIDRIGISRDDADILNEPHGARAENDDMPILENAPAGLTARVSQSTSEGPDLFTDCVRSKIAMLSKIHKEVIHLVRYAHRTYEEAAEILECSIGTIRSRFNRAKEKLAPLVRECLEYRKG